MKNNTQNSKELLFKALHNLPEDFALREAKQQIVRAINEIEKIEGRRAQREQNLQKEKEKEKKIFISPYTASQQLQEIENMINSEKKRLEALQEKKKNKDDEDLQTIYD